MTPETCVQVSQQFAADILQIFDYGMVLGGLLFAVGWLVGGGLETLIDMYHRLKAKK